MPPQIRGDALPIFRGIHSSRWTNYLVRGFYVPLKVSRGVPLSMVSRDPTLPVAIDPSLPTFYQPALLVKAGVHGNVEDLVLVGGQLVAFLGLFGRDLEPPVSLLAAALRR